MSWKIHDSVPDNHHLVLVVGMIGVSRIEEVELGIVDLILERKMLQIIMARHAYVELCQN